jgi:hypothetical protein
MEVTNVNYFMNENCAFCDVVETRLGQERPSKHIQIYEIKMKINKNK